MPYRPGMFAATAATARPFVERFLAPARMPKSSRRRRASCWQSGAFGSCKWLVGGWLVCWLFCFSVFEAEIGLFLGGEV